jgi:hypothetical protein
MLNLTNIWITLFEGIAITIAIYLVTNRQLQIVEVLTLIVSISLTFLILDLFAPGIATGARQGTGFGLGFKQVGGTSHQNHQNQNQNSVCQNGQCLSGTVVEGMDDPIAIDHYQRYNPNQKNYMPPPINTIEIDQGAPHITNYDGHSQPIVCQKEKMLPNSNQRLQKELVTENEYLDHRPNQMSSQIAMKLRENPFNTTVRSSTEIDLPGAAYGPDYHNVLSQTVPTPTLYSPLKPTYGFDYQLPRGWDNLEQNNLSKTFNLPMNESCQKKNFK